MALSMKRLAIERLAAADGSVALYTVPAGHRALLRDIRTSKFTAAGYVILVLDPAAGDTVSLWGVGSVGADTWSGATDLFIVLEPGDQITGLVTAGGADVVLSGHEFVL